MSPDELDNLTPREFNNKFNGFEELQNLRDRSEWEKFRMLAATLLTPHTKGGKGIKPQKLWPFAWDQKPKSGQSEKMSEQRLDYLNKRSKLLKNG